MEQFLLGLLVYGKENLLEIVNRFGDGGYKRMAECIHPPVPLSKGDECYSTSCKFFNFFFFNGYLLLLRKRLDIL